MAATLKSVKKENTKNQREKEVLQTDVEALMKENKNLKGQIERLLSQPKETQ